MAGDTVSKVFDVESSLEAGGEEAAERCNEGCKAGQDQEMELICRIWDRRHGATKLEISNPSNQLYP